MFSGLANNNFLSLDDNDNGRHTTNMDTPNLGLTGRNLGLAIQEDTDEGSMMREAQKELEWLYRKLVFAGETLRDRRRVAYKSRSRRVKERDCNDDDDDDELWGVQAPEGVALLSFGLLLQLLVGSSRNDGAEENEFLTELSKWGQACTSMANDDCAAFAYLERVLNGVVVNPLEGVRDRLSTRLGTGNGGGAEIVRVLAGRREITTLADGDSMALTDGEDATVTREDHDFITGLPVDASSVVYSSIGREILSATIRVFKKSLLSLQSSSAVDNIGMLVDLAAIIYRHSTPLCDQFWSDWNEFSSAMTDDEGASPNSSDEAMCFLLETAHNLATATLAELESGSRQEAIIKYLRPMSSFLHLISSLCPSSLVVHNVLDSGFLPDGLVSKAVSLCSALAPMASSLNESNQPVTSDERRTIQHATVAMQSIATLAYLGGQPAKDWLRSSLGNVGQPRTLFSIASNALPRRNGAVSQECLDLASGALSLLSELLTDASMPHHVEAVECFASSSSDTFSQREDSVISSFLSGGIQNNVTLSTMSIISTLAINLDRCAFDESVTSRSVCLFLETLRDGVRAGLHVLSSLFSSGEVLPLTTHTQVDVVYTIMLSTVATLMGIRSVMYCHKDEHVRAAALAVRDEIVSTLASSTALGQIIAYLSSAPLTVSKTSLLHERDLAGTAESTFAQTVSSDDYDKYGAWGRFLTPKRKAQKSLQKDTEKDANADKAAGLLNVDSSLSHVSEMSLACLLIWSSHVDDIFGPSQKSLDESFITYSPHILLLSKVPSSSAYNAPQLNMSTLNIISRFINAENENQLSNLSAKVIKMCLQQASYAAQCSGEDQMTQAGIPTAFADGFAILSTAITRSLKSVFENSDFAVGMEQRCALTVSCLETVAFAISQQPDFARFMLSGKKGVKDFRLLDEIVSAIQSTISIINLNNQDEQHDRRVFRLRCAVANSCVEVILELWKCCRLGALNRMEYHACGGVVGRLASDTDSSPKIANLVIELARASLLAVSKQDDKQSMQDEVPIALIHQKSILLGLLSKCLSFVTIEFVARTQIDEKKGLAFIAEIMDTSPRECLMLLLYSNSTPAIAASSWKECNMNTTLGAFLKAYPSETTKNSCSLDLALRQTNSLQKDYVSKWLAFHNLALSEATYAARLSEFFDAANLASSRLAEEVLSLSASVIDGVLAGLTSISESNLSFQSLVLPDVATSHMMMAPFDQLCSVLLTSLSSRAKLHKTKEGEALLKRLSDLHEASNRIFILTQTCSLDDVNKVRFK